ncbi:MULTISPECIES: SDR family oxidoreductase [Cryobacterium]|uniref:SDR family oxidoreductase n=1 Tax=Cryobacterium TaxID=69578 RepID=UPI000CD45F01|nr:MULTISPECIES: SDR family oxidoreductase [Cryobacterium]POH63753.1 NAD-dependent dehydratase [Cryobacterium zongtaii]TFC40886.1 SDR family oxidoreductase [Cryobacterium sp. TMN-39-2]
MPISSEALPVPDPDTAGPTGTPSQPGRTALVAGASGIAGSALVDLLTAEGWSVIALSRTPVAARPGVIPVSADLRSVDSLRTALAPHSPTHVFFTAWLRQDTEAENIVVNSAMVRDLLSALADAPVQHVALMTGLKQYLGPFEAYGQGEVPDTPFHEDEPRLSVENFYYAQEDELWAAARARGFTWSVHRAHTVIGHAVGNAMNMGSTLAVYAAICKELDRPFIFPGSETQWNGVTDMTDAGLLADQMVWAATTPAAADTAFNIVNGDTFRWRWLWPRLAAHFGVAPEGFAGAPRPLETQMTDAQPVWDRIVASHGLVESDLTRLASWWHSDADLGRTMEVFADMGRSRAAGFTGYRNTEQAFLDLFARYRAERLIP